MFKIINDTNFSVVVLCPECTPAALKYTVTSLKADFPNVPFVVVIGNNIHEDNVKDLKKICNIEIAGKTITSLIDFGLETAKKSWIFVIVAGSRLSYKVFKKYAYFVKESKDILFPVIDRKYIFDEASINGILVHKNVVEEVGKFGDGNLSQAKLYWASKAMEKGYKFKALVGARLL